QVRRVAKSLAQRRREPEHDFTKTNDVGHSRRLGGGSGASKHGYAKVVRQFTATIPRWPSGGRSRTFLRYEQPRSPAVIKRGEHLPASPSLFRVRVFARR